MSKVRNDEPFFTAEQKLLIREHLLSGAPEMEIERFLITCERTGLDPFTRQIYGNVQRKKIKTRKGNAWVEEWIPTVVIITSIDGFRAIAERSGEYLGQTPPQWYCDRHEGDRADWHDVFIPVRDQRQNPLTSPHACRVGVLRKGFPEPCYGVANFESFAKYYKPEGGEYQLEAFWKKMPEHMIAKVAEAQAFRKAFPLLACGIYLDEEIGRDDEDEKPATEAPQEPLAEKVISIAPPTKAAPAPAATPAPVAAEPENPPFTPDEALVTPAPEAKAKKAGGKKAAQAAAPETPPPAAPEPKAEESNPEWQDYVISQITITKFHGKKLSEISPAEIKGLYDGWVVKYGDRFKDQPAKVAEARAITAAHEATKG